MRPPPFELDEPTPTPAGLRCLVLEIGDALVAVLTFELGAGALPGELLTTAEARVVRAIFEGKSNDAIARERGTSPRTVANQVASIFRKHRVASRAELVAHYLVELSA